LVFVGALATAASTAFAGGIADEPCPNVQGEHTNTCPPGTVGMPYHLRFRENEGSGCGPGQQTFHLDSGALPAGLALLPDGTLSGTPSETGRFRFYVEMREPQADPTTCAGKRTQKEFSLRVRQPVSIASMPPTPPPSEVGAPLRIRLRARGGSGVFAWTAVIARLPKGLRLRPSGLLEGSPRAPGTYHLEVRARDTEARVQVWRAELRVAPRLALRPRKLATARVDRRYTVTLTATGGVASRRWMLVGGRLPRGVRLLSDGRLVGTPRRAGTYRFTARVRDGLQVRATAAFAILVRP
jgi:Putative Ig domain